jgi:hypothetical protein
MCWSFEVSIAAFLWCTAVALYLRYRRASDRDEWAWRFLLAYGLVQLCDAVFWTTQLPSHDPNSPAPQSVCDAANHFLSEKVLPIVLTGAVAVQLHQAITWILKRDLSWFVSSAFLIWTLSAPTRFPMYWGEPPYCTTLFESRTLLWGDRPATKAQLWIYGGTLGFSLPFLAMRPLHLGMLYAGLGMLSSYVAYAKEPTAWGSNWCFIAVIFSFVFLVEPMVSGAVHKSAIIGANEDKRLKAQ